MGRRPGRGCGHKRRQGPVVGSGLLRDGRTVGEGVVLENPPRTNNLTIFVGLFSGHWINYPI